MEVDTCGNEGRRYGRLSLFIMPISELVSILSNAYRTFTVFLMCCILQTHLSECFERKAALVVFLGFQL